MAAGRFSVEAVFKGIDKITAPVSRMQNRIGKFTRKVSKNLRKVNRQIGKMAGGLRAAASRALKFGGVAVVAGLTATTLAINKVAGAADELAKRSRRLQFPIEDLQEWQFVAEQSGLSTEQFDKSIEKFAKSVGEARAGTGTLVTILKKSNPELLKQVTSADNAAEAFDIYINALRGTENQLDKAALSTAAFGRTGAKFLNITEQSAEAIKALRKEQFENGVITAQQAAAAEAYNDAVNSLKKSLFGLLQNVILPLLPAITKTVRGWRDLIVANKDLVRNKVMEFFKAIKSSVLEVIAVFKDMARQGELLDNIKIILVGIVKAFAFLARHKDTILAIGLAIGALVLTLKTFAAIMTIVNVVMAANPVSLIVLGVAALIAALAILVIKWDAVKAAMLGVVNLAKNSILGKLISFAIGTGVKGLKAVSGAAGSALNAVGSALGIGGSEEREQEREVISPQERMVRRIETSSSVNKTELRIKDETGRAEMEGRPGPGVGIVLARSGAF
jgi:hypothetical protein